MLVRQPAGSDPALEQLVPAFLPPAVSGRGHFANKTVGMGYPPAAAVEERGPEHLHPHPHPSGAAHHPVTAGQDKVVTPAGQEYPAAVGPEPAGWHHPAGTVGLHDAVRLFTVTPPGIGRVADFPPVPGQKGRVVGAVRIRCRIMGGQETKPAGTDTLPDATPQCIGADAQCTHAMPKGDVTDTVFLRQCGNHRRTMGDRRTMPVPVIANAASPVIPVGGDNAVPG